MTKRHTQTIDIAGYTKASLYVTSNAYFEQKLRLMCDEVDGMEIPPESSGPNPGKTPDRKWVELTNIPLPTLEGSTTITLLFELHYVTDDGSVLPHQGVRCTNSSSKYVISANDNDSDDDYNDTQIVIELS